MINSEIQNVAARSVTHGRTAFIDHLRIFLTVVVIMHHAAITFGASGGWYYFAAKSTDLAGWQHFFFSIMNSVDQAYFMGFFFLIAGYFTPTSLARKGAGVFLRDRLLRLGVPLAIFAGLLGPVTIGIAQVLRGQSFSDGFHWVYGLGHYECGPMWFVQALLIFAVLYVAWRTLAPRVSEGDGKAPLPRFRTLLGAALATGLFAFAIRQFVPAGKNVFSMQLGYFATYIVLFYVGCRAARDHWLERVDFRSALTWALIAVVTICLQPVAGALDKCGLPWSGGCNPFSLFYAMWEPFVAWGAILGLLYFARRFLSGTNAFLQHLARCSFAVYVVHAPVLVGLTLLFHHWGAAPFAKWLVVGPLACVVSWLVASAIVKTPWLKRIF